jgi:hypothetical protein
MQKELSMRIHPQCIVCQVNVRYRDLEKLGSRFSNEEKIAIMKSILDAISKFVVECQEGATPCIPALLATRLYRYIKRVTSVNDPYFDEKVNAHKEALKLYEEAKRIIFSEKNVKTRLYRALQFSLVGNLLDFGVMGFTPPSIDELMSKALNLRIWGDTDTAMNILLSARNIAVVLDNAGEAVFDRLLADVLRDVGAKVYAIVKGGSFQNDVTIEDAYFAKLNESFDKIVSTGSDAASIFIEELSNEAREIINSSDVIVSKGMANYEYISEIAPMLGKPIVFVLVAKCLPISISTGIPLGEAGIAIYTAGDSV